MKKYTTYYGAYNLETWVDMILKKEIELPTYQRDFVWSESKVINLLKSLKNGDFVPPITIGTYIDPEKNIHHYILDGQQRLRALLLGKLGYFPNGKDFSSNGKVFANNNDDMEENEKDENPKAWRLDEVQKLGSKKEIFDIVPKSTAYHKLGAEMKEALSLDKDFWNKTGIGFSYIKPSFDSDDVEQKKYFSTLFRNINNTAVTLTPVESRSSLYWLDSSWLKIFQPSGEIEDIKINNADCDFVRILSVLSQYYKKNDTKYIAMGYSSRAHKNFENYIEDFIYSVVGEQKNDLFSDFNSLYPNKEKDYTPLIGEINKEYNEASFPKKFETIISADLYLFGFVYVILFLKKKIRKDMYKTIKDEIEDYTKRVSSAHKKSPASLIWLRERASFSIQIYQKYCQ